MPDCEYDFLFIFFQVDTQRGPAVNAGPAAAHLSLQSLSSPNDSSMWGEIKNGRPVYLKQLIGFEFLGAEDDAVSVASNSNGLAALAQQHHILAMFAVETMGHACS